MKGMRIKDRLSLIQQKDKQATEQIKRFNAKTQKYTPVNLSEDKKAIAVFLEHARLQLKHCVLLKRTKVFIYRRFLEMIRQKVRKEGIPFSEALNKIEVSDLNTREKVLNELERAVHTQNALDVDIAIKRFSQVAESSFQYGLYNSEDKEKNIQTLIDQGKRGVSDSEEEFHDIDEEDVGYKKKVKELYDRFKEMYEVSAKM